MLPIPRFEVMFVVDIHCQSYGDRHHQCCLRMLVNFRKPQNAGCQLGWFAKKCQEDKMPMFKMRWAFMVYPEDPCMKYLPTLTPKVI